VVEPQDSEGNVSQVAIPGSRATVENLQMSEPAIWLLEEYKLLSAHYFHEDNYFQHLIATFTTLNSGLIAFYASDLILRTSVARFSIPAIGIILTLAWTVSMLRARELRLYAQNRMVEMESALHELWHGLELPIRPLDIGTRVRWGEVGRTGFWGKLRLGWIRNIQASKVAFVLPSTFAIVWIVLLAV